MKTLIKYLLAVSLLTLKCSVYSQVQGESKVDSLTENGWTRVDVQPKFPGGIANFYKYIGENLKYPKDAKRQGIQGKVMVEFVIDSIGVIKPSSIKVAKGIFPSCDEEAIRVISQSPHWTPAYVTKLNKSVATKMVVNVIFKL
jgi:protein TonB